MESANRRLPRLVRRVSSPHLMTNVLISFGATVLLVRLFLEFTGYPRLGNSTLHIAHMLYGGLFLTASCLLMLIFASPSAHRIASVLTGIGLGLFFDEIGKFITSNNDYFYRPAAPIIYVFSLIIAMLIYILRRREARPTDEELAVAALEDAEALLEGRQTEQQHKRIDADLDRLSKTMSDPDYVELAHALRTFADSEAIQSGKSPWAIVIGRIEHRLLRRFVRYQKLLTIVLLLALAINSLGSLLIFAVATLAPIAAPSLARALENLYATTGLRALSPFDLSLNDIDLLLNLATAALTLYGIVLFVRGRQLHGLFWIQLALILQLCVVNVFTFYVEQFSAALITLANLAVLLYVRIYQHQLRQANFYRRLEAQHAHPPAPPPAADTANQPAATS